RATLGSKVATFTLKDGRLVSGDWVLGRNLTEDRSLGPNKIAWFKDNSESGKRLHVVNAHVDRGSHQLKFGGNGDLDGCLMASDDEVFVDLIGMEGACSTVKYKE
ncbi:hypothetical protein BU23DRAFT_448394, partial [Bimuria novae-zelandiae CBS 107.79]